MPNCYEYEKIYEKALADNDQSTLAEFAPFAPEHVLNSRIVGSNRATVEAYRRAGVTLPDPLPFDERGKLDLGEIAPFNDCGVFLAEFREPVKVIESEKLEIEVIVSQLPNKNWCAGWGFEVATNSWGGGGYPSIFETETYATKEDALITTATKVVKDILNAEDVKSGVKALAQKALDAFVEKVCPTQLSLF